MKTPFDTFHRQLGRVTLGMLLAGISIYMLTLLCALLGFREAVMSFNSVSLSLLYVFGILFSVFVVSSIADAVIRWIDRRNQV